MRPAHVLARVLRAVVPVTLLASLVGTAVPAHAVAYPYVQITSPGATSSAAGTTAFQFTGAVDPAGIDMTADFGLVVDGARTGGLVHCTPELPKSCSNQLLWEATAPAGSTVVHSVQVEMYTTQGLNVLSPAVSVTATHAIASPVINDPAPGSNVLAPDVFVDADTSFAAPRYGDLALAMALLVDGSQVDTSSCDASTADTSCPSFFYWDASSATLGDHTLQVRVTTTSGGSFTSAAEHVNLVQPPTPVVTIASPATGSTVSGVVALTATGSVDGTYGDAPMLMGLFVDGTLVGPTQDCPATGPCTLTFPWDTTGKYGAHQVVVALLTQQYVEGDSAPLTLTVRQPLPPTVVITSPAPLASVVGSTTVSATATLDPQAHDRAVAMQLVVDGAPVGTPIFCSSDATTTCSVSLPWNPQGLLGNHNIAVRLDTTKTSVTSALRQVSVTQYSQPGQTKLTFGVTTSQAQFYATGRVTDRLQRPVSGVPVTLTVKPAVGQTRTLYGTSSADGSYSILIGKRPSTDSTLAVQLSADYGSVSATGTLDAHPTLKCGIPKTIKHAATATVTCTLPYAPKGLKATLSSTGKAGVRTLGHALAKNGKFTFTFKIAAKGQRLRLWVIVAKSHVFGHGAESTPVKVHVV